MAPEPTSHTHTKPLSHVLPTLIHHTSTSQNPLITELVYEQPMSLILHLVLCPANLTATHFGMATAPALEGGRILDAMGSLEGLDGPGPSWRLAAAPLPPDTACPAQGPTIRRAATRTRSPGCASSAALQAGTPRRAGMAPGRHRLRPGMIRPRRPPAGVPGCRTLPRCRLS